MIFLVTIQDKSLYGEPDVAIAVVEAADELAARLTAHPTIDQLADAGRGRCVPHARAIEPGKFYRLGAMVRLPRDPNAEDDRPATAWRPTTETIVAAAIRVGGIVYSVPRPGRHHDVFKAMTEREAAASRLEDQGFVTSTGRFVNRAEAADLARAANQLIREPTPADTLTSEDVW